MASKCIRRELEDLQKDPPTSFSVDLADDDLFHRQAKITGPSNSPYSGGTFVVDICFPVVYPFHPKDPGKPLRYYRSAILLKGLLTWLWVERDKGTYFVSRLFRF